MLSSLTEAQQAAACFTLSFPTDCFLLRLIIYQGEHLPNSLEEGLAEEELHSGQLGDSRAQGSQDSSRGLCFPGTACPTPTMDVPWQRGPACAQRIWVHVLIPDEHFWGLVCSFLRDLTESISSLQVFCNHWWPLSSFLQTLTHKCPFMDKRSFPQYSVFVSVPQSLQQQWEPTLSQCDPWDPPGPATGRSLGTESFSGSTEQSAFPLTACALVFPLLCWAWLFFCPGPNGRGKCKITFSNVAV